MSEENTNEKMMASFLQSIIQAYVDKFKQRLDSFKTDTVSKIDDFGDEVGKLIEESFGENVLNEMESNIRKFKDKFDEIEKNRKRTDEVLWELCYQDTQKDILESILKACEMVSRRAVLYLVKGNNLKYWNAYGYDEKILEQAKNFEASYENISLLEGVLNSKDICIFSKEDGVEMLSDLYLPSTQVPAKVVILPLKIFDAIPAIVILDGENLFIEEHNAMSYLKKVMILATFTIENLAMKKSLGINLITAPVEQESVRGKVEQPVDKELFEEEIKEQESVEVQPDSIQVEEEREKETPTESAPEEILEQVNEYDSVVAEESLQVEEVKEKIPPEESGNIVEEELDKAELTIEETIAEDQVGKEEKIETREEESIPYEEEAIQEEAEETKLPDGDTFYGFETVEGESATDEVVEEGVISEENISLDESEEFDAGATVMDIESGIEKNVKIPEEIEVAGDESEDKIDLEEKSLEDIALEENIIISEEEKITPKVEETLMQETVQPEEAEQESLWSTPEEEKLHNDARRFARLLVSEIKLYNEDEVVEGREKKDLYKRLQKDIDRSREMYDKRVAPEVAKKVDYFHLEMVRILGEGDESKLGEGYPGPKLIAD